MAIETVLLKTSLTANTGYGNDGFNLTRSLVEEGMDVRLSPTAVTPPLPMETAARLTLPTDLDFDYFVNHAAPFDLAMSSGEKRSARRKIGWTMWEFTSFGHKPTPEPGETFIHGDPAEVTSSLQGYDLLLAYDPVSAQALQPHADAAGVPIQILQGGYRAENWDFDLRTREWEDVPFRFGMVGQLHSRKNPFAAVRAFQRMLEEGIFKPGEAELHLKTTVLGLHPAMEEHNPGLKIHYELWSHDQLKAFYASLHTLLAPSWGEGKNLPALEAQTMGVPTIATAFGGHTMWQGSEWGWPVGYKLEDHESCGMHSARIDEDALFEAMCEAYSNRALTKKKGMVAAKVIPGMCDWAPVTRRLHEILRTL